jgi:UDP-glucose 4-epimerase
VRVLDNLATGRRENLAGVLDTASGYPGGAWYASGARGRCELVVADVRDEAALAAVLDGAGEVFHLACLGLRRSLRDPEESHEVNATGTLRLLAAARRAGVGRFLHVSSSEVYGSGAPAGGRRRRGMDEDHPTRPTTAYGAAKLAGEAYARSYHRVHGLPVAIVRPFNAYGPRSHHEGDAGEVIPRFLVRALAGQPLIVFGNGRQTRDFTHVRDVARGLRRAAACDMAVGETLNLGSETEISIAALARQIRRLCRRPELAIVHHPPRPGDLLRLRADASRAQSLLGWAPRVAWVKGLRELKEWIERGARTPEELLREQDESPSWSDPARAERSL